MKMLAHFHQGMPEGARRLGATVAVASGIAVAVLAAIHPGRYWLAFVFIGVVLATYVLRVRRSR